MKTRKEFMFEEMSEYMTFFNESRKTTGEQKWFEAENMYQDKYNRPKYTTYGSFRVAKSNYINELREQVRKRNFKRKI
jgi:hypothetical protein